MGSSVRQDANAYLKALIKDLQTRIDFLEEKALTSSDVVAESLQLGEPTTKPSGIGDASLAANLNVEGTFTNTAVNAGLVTGGDSHDHDGGDGAVIPENGLATAVKDQLVTGGDSHDHDGGDGAVIPEGGLATAVSDQLVTGGDSHDHIGGDGAAIDTDALAAKAVTTAKIDDNAVDTLQLAAQAVDTAQLANLAVGTAKMVADSVDDTKAGDRVPQFYRRKGGSSTNWSTQGGNNYTPGAVRMQGGVVRITIADGTTGNTGSLNFPISFSNAPIVVIGVKCSNRVHVRIDPVTSSVLGYGAFRTSSSGAWDVDIHWLAIGPE